MKNIFFLSISLFLISCGNDTVTSVKADIIEKTDPNGLITERQQVTNGQNTGVFVEYYPEKGLPKKVQTLDNGVPDGPYMEFNNRGQIEKMANYKDNQLHGDYATYKFGRVIEKSSYKNGKLHGTYRSYFNNSDKLQKEAEYVDGIQHGVFKQFNEEGQVVLEYQYKNGEVVKGGMVAE
jgi:antitoxin component YwqK of YwqJK toxin-antitoxin module